MLDVFDFIKEKGGNPEKIKESQRRRSAPEEAVDEVIELYEDHRKSKYNHVWIIREIYILIIHSSIFCHPNQHQDQRDPKTNWYQEEGKGRCGRSDEAEGRL